MTDPAVAVEWTTHRDTQAGTSGHAAHGLLEHTANEVGRALLEDRAPHLLPAYADWRGRFERPV